MMSRSTFVIAVLLAASAILQVDMASAQNATRKCNGSEKYCSIPYSKFTFPGTHNSVAYNLRPDCANIEQCEGAKNFCVKSEQECVGGWTEKCESTSKECKTKLPPFLGGLCTAWGTVCKSPTKVCGAWKDTCKGSINLCTKGLPMMCKDAPEWMRKCFWENQPDHDIDTQLKDGIRAFDIDTCVIGDGSVITCHGMGPSRALGSPLDNHLAQVRDFLKANPDEVITLEYGDFDGDASKNAMAIKQKLEEYLPGKMLERNDASAPWPTLGEILAQGKQVVVFMGRQLPSFPEGSRPAWANDRAAHYVGTWDYTNSAHDDKTVAAAMIDYANKNDGKSNLWQCLDFEYSPDKNSVLDDLKKLQQPALCLQRLAKVMNPQLDAVSSAYSAKFQHIHRLRIDYYYNNKEQLLRVVERLNARHIQS
ncbi:PLC-like phosphodiesterase [Syncephalis plumigaleata]|nr:PLC-like phosphodiesterase [Syncephalis plumigaleata]